MGRDIVAGKARTMSSTRKAKSKAKAKPRPKAKPKAKPEPKPPRPKRPPKKRPPAKKKPAPKKKTPGKRPPRPKRPPRGRDVADPGLVERTVLLVRETDRAIAKGKRRVGAMLLDEYFGGDPGLALARGPSRSKSYALLASVIEDTTGWDARDLNECVRIEIVARSLPPDLADALAVSHLLRLSSLRNPRTREALARRIVAGELRGDRLKRLIAEEGAREDAAQPPGAPPKPDRPGGSLTGGGGPRRRPDAVVAVAALKRVMERAQDDQAFTAAEIREVRPKQRERLARELDAASRKLARWSAKLRATAE